ncbi:MAG: hypothetical protein H7836_16610 [Magnetococcus sp. YQC-3]
MAADSSSSKSVSSSSVAETILDTASPLCIITPEEYKEFKRLKDLYKEDENTDYKEVFEEIDNISKPEQKARAIFMLSQDMEIMNALIREFRKAHPDYGGISGQLVQIASSLDIIDYIIQK